MTEIVQAKNPILRKISKEVNVPDITKHEIQKLLKDMSDALHSQDDGVAIAAPQIGVPLRVFIVSGRIFDEDFMRQEDNHTKQGLRKQSRHPDLIFINPILTRISKHKQSLEEGCLSVRPIYGRVRRSSKATIEAYDENGLKINRGASGLLAQIFQHEIDHLEGILFTDTAKDLHEVILK